MTKQDDKKYLKDLANKVLVAIKEEGLSTPFIASKKITTSATNTNGWNARLGIFNGYQSSVEIWFDEFTASKKRKIYYGIFSNKHDGVGIKKIVAQSNLSKVGLGEPILFSLSNLSDKEGGAQLKEPLPFEDFDKLIFEQYPENNEYFYGVYEYRKVGLQGKEARRLILRITEFIVTINSALLLEKIKGAKSQKGFENQLIAQQYLRRERSRYLANLRKQHDNYVCGICGFDFSKTYGQLGNDFAEAHHIVPLKTNDKERTTTITDLITVCANCHRMLDRMDGTPGDIAKLKKIVNKKK